MTKKLSMKRAIFAGTAIVASIAFAGITGDSFEDGNIGSWSAGTVSAPTKTVSNSAGLPLSNDHNYVLCIDGETSRSNTGTADTNGKAQLNFLAYITEASDELPTESMGDVQIAFAAGTTLDTESNTVPLMLYCKAKDGTGAAAWQGADATLNATLELNEWHHIQLLFDYTKGVCQVCVDGVPVVSALGRFKADSADSDTNDGSWYVLAKTPASNLVGNLTMYGTAQIDDVVVQEGSSSKFNGSSSVTIGSTALSYETLAKFGVNETTITQAKLGSSDNSLTVAQCLQCGIDPAGTGEFKVESASLASDGKLELEFPGSVSALNGVTPQYRIEWVGLNQADTKPTVTAINGETGKVKATVAIPEGLQNQKVLKYRLKAVAPSAQ